MHTWICKACCAEFPASAEPPAECPICRDPRQYIGPEGQQWTHEAALIASGHKTELRDIEPGLLGIGVTPQAGIGQRALLIEHPQGGVLWDGVPLLDDAALAEIERRGGVRAIVASHPHLYGAIATNSEKLGNVPVYLPEADRQWLMRPHRNIRFFSEDCLDLGHGVTLHVTGGHFDGSAVLHWPEGAGGKGAIMTGDTIIVAADTDWVSFIWSAPNRVPLGIKPMRHIVEVTEKLSYDRLYAGWWEAVVKTGAKAKIAASERRILEILGVA